MHESLGNTIDYIEMPSRNRLLFSGTGNILAQVQKLGGEITREIFEFPGGRRFHFREPGGEFAVWSDK